LQKLISKNKKELRLMKNTKICPKCNNNNCVYVQNMYGNQSNSIKIGTFMCVDVSKYVCLDCGYVEEWIANDGDLNSIRNIFLDKE
jgi:predicted nucleic-acid-binding Zn-ribbon protein